jgi:hypothetical protein
MGQMNLNAYKRGLEQDADKLHTQAQDEGSPEKYEQAAELYDQIWQHDLADQCRLAAHRLRNVSPEA